MGGKDGWGRPVRPFRSGWRGVVRWVSFWVRVRVGALGWLGRWLVRRVEVEGGGGVGGGRCRRNGIVGGVWLGRGFQRVMWSFEIRRSCDVLLVVLFDVVGVT